MMTTGMTARDRAVKPKVIVVCGPTGIGKTDVAIDLAGRFGGHIVSADSMQIYRYMDIGTAKPGLSARALVPHHLIDIVDPDEDFSAGRYASLADETITGLSRDGRLPFLAGGTGLYIKACLHGLFRKRQADGVVLARLTGEAEDRGAPVMHERLLACDPEAARRINRRDAFRIVRALELFETTGRPASEHVRGHGFAESRYQTLTIGLYQDREDLYRRINSRATAMLAAGLVDEVKRLLDMGYSPRLKSMQSIGYRHVAQYLDNRISREEMIATLQRDTRRYAKRQLTWFRADPDICWVDIKEGLEKIDFLIRRFLDMSL